MDDLKIGEYARLEDGNIIRLNEKNITDERLLKEIKIHDLDIKKIIEAGDYVNGRRVMFNKDNSDLVVDYNDYTGEYTFIYKKEIKDIVTHELFEDMKFKM